MKLSTRDTARIFKEVKDEHSSYYGYFVRDNVCLVYSQIYGFYVKVNDLGTFNIKPIIAYNLIKTS